MLMMNVKTMNSSSSYTENRYLKNTRDCFPRCSTWWFNRFWKM